MFRSALKALAITAVIAAAAELLRRLTGDAQPASIRAAVTASAPPAAEPPSPEPSGAPAAISVTRKDLYERHRTSTSGAAHR